jgi:DUF1680 family protein
MNRFGIIAVLLAGTLACADSLSDNPLNKAPRKVELKAEAFDLEDVRLGDGLFKNAMQRNEKYLLELDPDRFLAWFRKEAGLEPKGEVYGGWESMGVAGHCLGHYLSAICMDYASGGAQELKARADYIVSELKECQQANGDGYLAAFPGGKRAFEEVRRGEIRSAGFDLNGIWVPWYTEHKVMAGLLDAYQLTGNKDALEVLVNMADWAIDVTRELTNENWQKMLACEHGGMNEICAELYAVTGEQKYLELAKKFYHKAILDPLSREENILPGKHANTQIPKIVGAATIYELTGDEKFFNISDFFWNDVTAHHTFANGGNSSNEHFGPRDALSTPMHDSTETCNSYNMLKLTRHLFALEPRASYMDYYERTLYNHILAHQHPTTGMLMYKGFMDMPAKKTFSTPFDSFWCCVGTGMENHTKYADSIYFHSGNKLYVNLFINSTLSWKAQGAVITQKTDMPLEGKTVLSFKKAAGKELTIALRKPFWAERVLVKLNGKPVKVSKSADGYMNVTGKFEAGDTISLDMSMGLRREALSDKPERGAFMYGPVLLATLLDDGKLPLLVGTDEEILTGITRANKDLTFIATGIARFDTGTTFTTKPLTMIPLYEIAEQPYSVYLDSFTPAKWQVRQAQYRAMLKERAELDARTTDILRIGEMQPERDHNLTGQNSRVGEFKGIKWRDAANGGWFEFEMKVDASAAMEIACKYWGSDRNGREFDIIIDSNIIATQTLQDNKPNEFFTVNYPIPKALTEGREAVTVRIQAKQGKLAGGIFGEIRMMKKKPE